MSEGAFALLPILLVLGVIIWLVIRSRKNEKIVIDENGNEVRSGLGGWLILVGLGVVFTPVRILALVGQDYLSMFNDGSYEILTTHGTEFYHPFWSTYIWGEIAINILIFFASLFLIFLFFSKRKLFPKFYIWLVVGSLAFIIIDAMLIKVVMPNEPIFDAETLQEIGRIIVVVLIWVPYMLISKRVKVTFVN